MAAFLDNFHDLHDPLPEAVLVLDAHGCLLAANSACRRLLLPRADDFVPGMPIEPLLKTPSDARRLRHMLPQWLQTRQALPVRLVFRGEGQTDHHGMTCIGFRIESNAEDVPAVLLRCQAPENLLDRRLTALHQELEHSGVQERHARWSAAAQELLAELSGRFINVSPAEMTAAIDRSLEQLGAFLAADRAYVFRYDMQARTASNTHEWCRTGIEPQRGSLQDLPIAMFSDLFDDTLNGIITTIEDVAALPADDPIAGILQPQGILSLQLVPMMDGESCLGFIGVDYVAEGHRFTVGETGLMRGFSDVLLNALRRIENLQRIQEQSRFLSDLIEHSGSLIAVKDRSSRYRMVNEAWQDAVGLTAEQVIGHTDAELFPADVARQFMRNDSLVVSSGRTMHLEEQIDDPDGRRYFVTTKFPTLDSSAEINGLCAMIMEITDQRRAQEIERMRSRTLAALAEGRDFDEVLNTVTRLIEGHVEHAICSIMVRGKDPEYLELLSGSALPADYSNVIADFRIAPGAGACGSAMSSGKPVYCTDISTDTRWRDLGTVRELALEAGFRAVWSYPFGNSEGKPEGTFAIYRTLAGAPSAAHQELLQATAQLLALTFQQRIMARQQVELEAARATSKAKSLFISNFSHEMRTPLNAILGFSRLLAEGPGLSQEQRSQLHLIRQNGEQLLRLISDILDFARLETGRPVIRPTRIDLHALLEDLEQTFRQRAREKGIALAVGMLAPGPAMLAADRGKLLQILTNLLDNGLKFTPSHGRVELTARLKSATERRRAELRIRVRDTGPGLSPAEQQRVFGVFEQGEAGIREGGTGLGLAICDQLIRLMGGSIRLESRAGKGTTFDIRLPVDTLDTDQPGADAETRLKPVAIAATRRSLRLLLVDGPVSRHSPLERLLADIGFIPLRIEQPQQILDQAASHDIDALIIAEQETGYPAQAFVDPVRSRHGHPLRHLPIAILETPTRQRPSSAGNHAQADRLTIEADGNTPYRPLLNWLRDALGLHYAYSTSTTEASGTEPPPGLDPTATRHLPDPLREQLREALQAGDMTRFNAGLQSLETVSPPLARHLGALASRFDYAALAEIVTDPQDGVQ